jgi:hypothetical protein
MERHRLHVYKRTPVATATAIIVVTALFAGTLRAAPTAAAPAQMPGVANGPPLTVGENADETYELNYVGLTHHEFGGYMGANGMYIPKTELWEGYRGKYKLKLGLVEFYDAVARPDLHVAATHHVILVSSLSVAGLGLMIGGAVYTFRGWNEGGGPPKLPLAAFAAGTILLLVVKSLTWQPTSEAEAYKLARIYNDQLRARLGLPPVIEDPTLQPTASRADRQRRLAVIPAVSQQGGGLMLMGLF